MLRLSSSAGAPLAALRSDKPFLGRCTVALLPWEALVEARGLVGLEEQLAPEGRVAVRADMGRGVGWAVGTVVATVG